MTFETLPADARTTVEGFTAAAREAFGDDLVSVVLFGTAAEGRMRPTSDINVIVVLKTFRAPSADQLREPYRVAAAAHSLQAMFLLESEIAEASHEFAQKFADVARRRLVVYGDDPFANLAISREALVRRVRQVLLNLALRLREIYVERSLREEQCAIALADAAGPLRTAAAAILELEGRGVKAPKEALAEVVAGLHRPDLAALLPHISEAREHRVLPNGEGARHLFAAAELARALHDRAKRL